MRRKLIPSSDRSVGGRYNYRPAQRDYEECPSLKYVLLSNKGCLPWRYSLSTTIIFTYQINRKQIRLNKSATLNITLTKVPRQFLNLFQHKRHSGYHATNKGNFSITIYQDYINRVSYDLLFSIKSRSKVSDSGGMGEL